MSETLPFYAEYAWAFDLLIDRPVEKECAVMAAWLVDRQILPGAAILDAGCGTGRYARELARRGYIVHGVDRSPEGPLLLAASAFLAPVALLAPILPAWCAVREGALLAVRHE